MKNNKPKAIKTENSPQKQNTNKYWLLHSSNKKERVSYTPIRFADIKVHLKRKQQQNGSTKDRETTNRKIIKLRAKTQIYEAIDAIREQSNSPNESMKQRQVQRITPFDLWGDKEVFESQMTFQGVNNRMKLLKNIQQIKTKICAIFQYIKALNNDSGIDFIRSKLDKYNSQMSKHLHISYFQFYQYLEGITKKVNDFAVELVRCQNIMKGKNTGISQRTMEFYLTKFSNLVNEMENNIRYLQSYIDLLHQSTKQDKRFKEKKYTLSELNHY